MEFRLSWVLAFLALAVVASQAALSPEQYWKYALPNTPMPKVVKDMLHPDMVEEKSTSVNVGGGGVNVNTGKGKPSGTSVNVGKGGVNVNTGKGKPSGTSVNVGKGGVNVNTGKGKPGGTSVNVGKGGVGVNTRKPGGGTSVNVGGKGGGVSRQIAQRIPFSSNKLPEILNKFSVTPGSAEAEMMKNTIEECEGPQIKGEEKYCATSLESMIDFSTSKIGKNVQAISTEVEKQTPLQKYTIADGVQKMSGDKSVVCHKQNYPYAIFYCHKSETTRAYTVPLEGADGTKAKAAAICHTDTSAWNPKHVAFQVLKVEPGTVPICHFLPQDHIVWVPK